MPPLPSPVQSPSTRCTAITAAGSPCKNWAVHRSQPPRCSAHGGGSRPVGAPPNNANARTHGLYAAKPGIRTIADVIDDLAQTQAILSALIEEHIEGEPDLDALVTLLRLHGQNASRLGRLLRDQRALSGEAADGIAGAIAQALDELGSELGVDL